MSKRLPPELEPKRKGRKMKKLFGILIIVLFTFAFIPMAEGIANAFEPGGTVRLEAGVNTGNDLSEASVDDFRIKGEMRLDPHQLLRLEFEFETGWAGGIYDKTVVTNIGAFVMPVRGKIDVGCGGRTDFLIDGRTSTLAAETSNKYWLGCLAEIRF